MKRFFLALETIGGMRMRVGLAAELSDVIKEWSHSTRVSPVYVDNDSTDVAFFAGSDRVLVFVALTSPSEAYSGVPSVSVWLTTGTYNLILLPNSLHEYKSLRRWLARADKRYEIWHVRNTEITRFHYFTTLIPDDGLRSEVIETVAVEVPRSLHTLSEEYGALMASAIARAEQVFPRLVTDLRLVNSDVRLRLLSNTDSPPEQRALETYDLLVSVNAALSRLSSQAFSGTSPISATECHFWTHSLLGTGLANTALWRLCQFPQKIIGEERIPEKLEALEDRPPLMLDKLRDDDKFWKRDQLAIVPAPDSEIIPLIPFFSGRDGFRSTTETLSAPLATIEACNSRRWTLHTLTHEISHVLVKGALGVLYPTDEYEFADASRILDEGPGNMLESVKRLLLLSVCYMEKRESGNDVEYQSEALKPIFEEWHQEVEEILAHVVDFLLFYGKQDEKYIKDIWTSWSVIPNISHRVPEYVLRTLCSVLPLYLEDSNGAEAAAIDTVQRVLEELADDEESGEYVRRALEYLRAERAHLRRLLFARRWLIRVGATFLYSERLATQLRRDLTKTSRKRGKKAGYDLTAGDFSRLRVSNPLEFVDAYTTRNPPDPHASLWMLYVLAFHTEGV